MFSYRGYLAIVYLWGRPFHWHLSPIGNVMTVIHHTAGHPKIAYLCKLNVYVHLLIP